jgi:hypothetical protein
VDYHQGGYAVANDSIDKSGLDEAENSRREFLKAAGKLAVYTPPVLMVLMRPTPNAIAQSAGQVHETDTSDHQEPTQTYSGDKNGSLVGTASEDSSSQRDFWIWR